MAKLTLQNLNARARRVAMSGSIERVLSVADAPMNTFELVKRLCEELDCTDETPYVAKELQKLVAGGHPLRRATGETFMKYGREMPRYEWLPSHKHHTGGRAAMIKAIEAAEAEESPADDEWTVYPTTPTGFLED